MSKNDRTEALEGMVLMLRRTGNLEGASRLRARIDAMKKTEEKVEVKPASKELQLDDLWERYEKSLKAGR